MLCQHFGQQYLPLPVQLTHLAKEQPPQIHYVLLLSLTQVHSCLSSHWIHWQKCPQSVTQHRETKYCCKIAHVWLPEVTQHTLTWLPSPSQLWVSLEWQFAFKALPHVTQYRSMNCCCCKDNRYEYNTDDKSSIVIIVWFGLLRPAHVPGCKCSWCIGQKNRQWQLTCHLKIQHCAHVCDDDYVPYYVTRNMCFAMWCRLCASPYAIYRPRWYTCLAGKSQAYLHISAGRQTKSGAQCMLQLHHHSSNSGHVGYSHNPLTHATDLGLMQLDLTL